MAVNKAVYGMLKYEKVLGNAITNILCKSGIQHLHIKFINGRGVYSSIFPPLPKGGKESKALRAREENQRRVKKKGREGEREGEKKEKGKGRKKKRE